MTAREIDEAAAHWVSRRDGDSWNTELEAELADWIAADPRHDGALLRAEAAWEMLRPQTPASAEPPVFGRPLHARMGRRQFVGATGALAAASAAGGIALLLPRTVYRTEVGEMRRIPLPDGSTVAINTASTIDVAFTKSLRRLTIRTGEAWFQVAHDSRRPFLVEAGRVRARAVGTAFSVRMRDDGSDVLVTEGVVRVWVEGADGQATDLQAGEQAFIANNAAVSRGVAEAQAIDRALAWRDGKIDLVGLPLADAVAEFNRYNKRKIHLADAGLAHEQFDGVFRTDDPLGFARAVEVSLKVPLDTSNPDRIDIGARRPESDSP